MPKKQIGDPSATLLIFLGQNLTDCSEGFSTETLCNLDQVIQFKRPIYANRTGLFLCFPRVYVSDDSLGFAVGNLDQAVIYFRCAGSVEGVGVEVKWAGLERSLKDVWDIGEEDIVEEIAELGLVRIRFDRGFESCSPTF